jgi:hypothetical protein
MGVLYIQKITKPKQDLLKLDLTATYKILNSPRRISLGSRYLQIERIHRLAFVSKRISTIVILGLFDTKVIQKLPSLLSIDLFDFVAPEHRQFNPQPLTLGTAMARAFLAFHWIWASFRLLTIANAAVSIVFVAVLRVDEPYEWPPLSRPVLLHRCRNHSYTLLAVLFCYVLCN